MSTFVQFYSGLLTAGSGVAGLQTYVDAIFTGAGWQRTRNDTVNFISEFIPPVTETIGDAYIQQRLRVIYATTTISFGMVNFPIANVAPQMDYIHAQTAGAVAAQVNLGGAKTTGSITASSSGSTLTVTGTPGVTLGPGSVITGAGVPANSWIVSNGSGTGGAGTYNMNHSLGTISSETMTATPFTAITGATGTSGSTANQNLRALYDALMAASADTDVAQFNYSYMPAPLGSPSNDYIIAERVAISGTLAPFIVNANVVGGTLADPILSGSLSAQEDWMGTQSVYQITVDLTDGTYFYASIFSRSFVLASKTTTSIYGPIFAAWIPNADALAMVPSKAPWMVFPKAHISEAVFGIINGSAASPAQTATVRYGNSWLVHNLWAYFPSSSQSSGVATAPPDPINGGVAGPFYMDFSSRNHYVSSSDAFTFSVSGLVNTSGFTQSAVADQGNIAFVGLGYAPSNTNGQGAVPGMVLDDVFCSLNADGNEVVEPSGYPTPSGCTLATAIAAGTAMTGSGTITVNSTTGFPSSGYLVMGQEVFNYTGTTSTTFTGVTRAYNATPQTAHYVNDVVQVAWWFVKINGGALATSTTRPS